jgi:hypothetical protein
LRLCQPEDCAYPHVGRYPVQVKRPQGGYLYTGEFVEMTVCQIDRVCWKVELAKKRRRRKGKLWKLST